MSGLGGQRYIRSTEIGDFLKAKWNKGSVCDFFFPISLPTCHLGNTLKKMPKVDIEIWVLFAFKRLCVKEKGKILVVGPWGFVFKKKKRSGLHAEDMAP